MPDRTDDLESSLLVMDIADRLDREDKDLEQATRLHESRESLKARVTQFYRSQGKTVSEKHIDQAISLRLDNRLVYTPPRGPRARLARAFVNLYDYERPERTALLIVGFLIMPPMLVVTVLACSVIGFLGLLGV